jgi:transcriptional regulator of acetoin/glycerol metabolism
MVEIRKGICDDTKNSPIHSGAPQRDARMHQEAHLIKPRNTVTKDGLVALLKSNNWNKSETARQIGISRVALWKKIKKFEIEHEIEHEKER